MEQKAVAFLKPVWVAGYELACSRCPVVLHIVHDPLCPFPKHRCGGKPRDFDIVLECGELDVHPGRIDRYWLSET